MQQLGFDRLVVHGSGPVAGRATPFALCGWQSPPSARHVHCLALLLPQLHLAFLKVASESRQQLSASAAPIARPLSRRERDILGWLREGKSNFEIGLILGISPITVKNHLQRIYRTLGVSNRTHAQARCLALHLPAASLIGERRAAAADPEGSTNRA